jgi:hypothetical protein
MFRGVYLAVDPALWMQSVLSVACIQLVVVHDDEVHYHEASGERADGQCEGTDALCGRGGVELGVLEGGAEQQARDGQAANEHGPHWNLVHLSYAVAQPKRRLPHRACGSPIRLPLPRAPIPRAARCIVKGQGGSLTTREPTATGHRVVSKPLTARARRDLLPRTGLRWVANRFRC